MIGSFQITQMIYVVAKLGIADLLHDGPQSADHLAQAVGAHPKSLYRVLRTLASVGIFAENDDGAFHLTPLAALLQTGVSGSLRGTAILFGEAWYWRSWSHLLHSVQTGETAFEHTHGVSYYGYFEQHADAAEVFNNVLTGMTSQDVKDILEAYDFSEIATLVDVGGGRGSLVSAILQAYPHMRGVLFDLPSVIADAKETMKAEDVADRFVSLLAGAFLTPCQQAEMPTCSSM
jgi:hypothetical protein